MGHLRYIKKLFNPSIFLLFYRIKGNYCRGRDGGQVVSVPASYSDDPSSNPAKVYNFSVKFYLKKNVNKQKRPGLAHEQCDQIKITKCL